ncbi:MXAN_5187 family protein [Haliangium sp.]|uniref:MXAN_5187 family protein n=1 Tax=Haliangium sp. TaxID=2663208 RepID=UPI003D1365E6
MFWSKIWYFLITVAGAAALTVALMLPRPPERQRLAEERQRVVTACDVVNILLATNARSRIDLAGTFARSEIDVPAVLAPATLARDISTEANQTARTVANQLLDSTTGDKPDFVFLVDGRGRVVARVGLHDERYGDTLAGYFLVDDALDGYMRDDLWLIDGTLYLTAAAPVIGNRWSGAVIIGHEMDKEMAEKLVVQLGVNLVAYAGGQPVATTNPVEVHSDALRQYALLSGAETPLQDDCRANDPFEVQTGGDVYTAQVARLPGEAGSQGAFFAVFVERPDALGFLGTLSAVTRDDISFGGFPWIWLGFGLLGCLGAGIGLMIFEMDRPLRRLSHDAVQLAQGAAERLPEERHRSHFGSIARSVNIQIDKAKREGRAPSQDSSASALPAVGPGGPGSPGFKPPPPSEFKFTDSKPLAPGLRAPSSPGLPGAPPLGSGSPPPATPNWRPHGKSSITAIDDVFASGVHDTGEIGPIDDSYRDVFEEFLALKRKCGEPTASLTYEKFAGKLRKSRDSLMAKHGCDDVKFQVYVKDGRAALKAKPIVSS